MQDKVYYHLGRVVAVSIAQGGSGLPCLSGSTFAYLSGQEIACISPNPSEVPDSCMLELITKVNIVDNVFFLFDKCYTSLQLDNATDVAKMREVARENRCLMIDAGVTQSPHLMELTTKPAILRALSLHHIVHSRAELDQFQDGLNCLRVLECVKAKPDMMKMYFLAPTVPLTAGKF